MRGSMLRRSCVDIRVCPTEVAVLCAILSMGGSVSCRRRGAILRGSGRRTRDLPPVLGRRVAAQHRVQPLAQLTGSVGATCMTARAGHTTFLAYEGVAS